MQRLIAKFNYHSDDLYIYKPGKGVVMTSTDRTYSIYGDKKRSDEFPFYDNLTVNIKLNSGENGELNWEQDSPIESVSEQILRNFIQKQIRGYQGSGTYKAEYLDPEIIKFIENNSEKVQVGLHVLPKVFYSGYDYEKNELIATTCNVAYYQRESEDIIVVDPDTKRVISKDDVVAEMFVNQDIRDLEENPEMPVYGDVSKVKDILYMCRDMEIEIPEKTD